MNYDMTMKILHRGIIHSLIECWFFTSTDRSGKIYFLPYWAGKRCVSFEIPFTQNVWAKDNFYGILITNFGRCTSWKTVVSWAKSEGNVLLCYYVLLCVGISPHNCCSIKEWHFYMVRSDRIRKLWPHGSGIRPSPSGHNILSFLP